MGLFNRKQKKLQKEREEREKQHKVTSNKVQIVVWRRQGKSLFGIADKFEAIETRETDTNLYAINEEKYFKEDLSFTKNNVYTVLEYFLNIQKEPRSKKRLILEKAIKEQEEFVNQFQHDVKLNEKYNLPDQEMKLRQLRVLLEDTYKDTVGEYMRLAEGGIRQYEFVAEDGVLYPYFFGARTFRADPDLTIRKKLFNSENLIFEKEMSAFNANTVSWIAIVLLICGLVFMAGNAFWAFKLYTSAEDINMQVNEGALTCTNTLAQIQSNYGGIIGDYLSEVRERNAQQQQGTNNNNNNGQGQININPSNINNN